MENPAAHRARSLPRPRPPTLLRVAFLGAVLGTGAGPAQAGDDAHSTQNVTHTDGTLESGWVISAPAGSSDYFNERYDGAAGRPIRGISIAVADFESNSSFPLAGLFDPDLTLDPSGNTPDLRSGLTVGPIGGGGLVGYVYAGFGGIWYPDRDPQHLVLQLPPGDSGLLGLGADSSGPDIAFSGYTQDGYATPANEFSGVNWGLNINLDAVTEVHAEGVDGRLLLYIDVDDMTGDFATVTLAGGHPYGWAFFAPLERSAWMLFTSASGVPVSPVSGALPTLPSPPGAWARIPTQWPPGFGDQTFTFVAVSGVPGVRGSVGVSSEVTINTLPDPNCEWGVKDDGSYESVWVVSIPAGSSDYFSNWFGMGCHPSVTEVLDFELAVMDFGATETAYPLSGIFAANYTIDLSGWTPDLSVGWEIAPFTFSPGSLVTTSAQLVVRTFAVPVPYDTFPSDDVHGVIQFPPGDSGLLAVGADTTPTPGVTWGSTWTLDGYQTPANRFDDAAGWGIRLGAR